MNAKGITIVLVTHEPDIFPNIVSVLSTLKMGLFPRMKQLKIEASLKVSL